MEYVLCIVIGFLMIITYRSHNINAWITGLGIFGIVIITAVMVFIANPSIYKLAVDMKEMKASMERFSAEIKSTQQMIAELLQGIKSQNANAGRGYTMPPAMPKGEGQKGRQIYNTR